MIRRVDNFRKGVRPKVNLIAQLEFELAYDVFAVHRFNHYTHEVTPLYRSTYFEYFYHISIYT